MALYDARYAAAPAFNVRAVEAGDAAEMVSRLTNEFAAAVTAGEARIVDFKIAGAASGLLWQAWFVVGTSEIGIPTAPLAGPAGVRVVAAEAGSPAEALFYAKQRLAAAIGVTPSLIFKTVVAGAGDGPTFMAIIVFAAQPG